MNDSKNHFALMCSARLHHRQTTRTRKENETVAGSEGVEVSQLPHRPRACGIRKIAECCERPNDIICAT